MASNHGTDDFPAKHRLDELLKGSQDAFGASGKYPMGKLTEDDEGEITFGITNTNGRVILNFGKPVAWLGIMPAQAVELAKYLMAHAEAAQIIGGANRHERRAKAKTHGVE